MKFIWIFYLKAYELQRFISAINQCECIEGAIWPNSQLIKSNWWGTCAKMFIIKITIDGSLDQKTSCVIELILDFKLFKIYSKYMSKNLYFLVNGETKRTKQRTLPKTLWFPLSVQISLIFLCFFKKNYRRRRKNNSGKCPLRINPSQCLLVGNVIFQKKIFFCCDKLFLY